MKLNKLFSILGLASAIAFTACTDEVEYTPAKAVNTPGVYFPTDNEINFTIDDQAGAQTINIFRQNTEGELVVSLQASGDTDKFSVPATVTFAGGSETATIAITPLVEQMENFTTYTIGLTVDDEFTSPYLLATWEGTFTFAVGEEWATLGNCVFTDDAVGPLFNNPCLSWDVEIQEHAQTPGLYRLVNPYGCETSPFKKYCVLSENYVVVNATNPEKVYFGENPNEKTTTGVDMGYGVMTLGLQAYGTLANGKITWPVKGLAIFDNDGGYYANQSGAFCIDLSGLK
ncbi:hypothetical protein [uncultured Duncaniella sp.]|uniref:hypothetical protein n=1 Tax=uncultured Duncaniella sp. TaxID=2768039 RepID=UPI0025D29C6B|nr:hypothetical protein [uncultured Duncaniella sp.]